MISEIQAISILSDSHMQIPWHKLTIFQFVWYTLFAETTSIPFCQKLPVIDIIKAL